MKPAIVIGSIALGMCASACLTFPDPASTLVSWSCNTSTQCIDGYSCSSGHCVLSGTEASPCLTYLGSAPTCSAYYAQECLSDGNGKYLCCYADGTVGETTGDRQVTCSDASGQFCITEARVCSCNEQAADPNTPSSACQPLAP